jgi:hypothetical protein
MTSAKGVILFYTFIYNITHRHKTAIVKKNKKICKKFTQNH